MPYPTRQTQLRGYGVIPAAAIPVATSIISGLFGRKRLASGVPASVYDDEKRDVDGIAAQGAAALQAFINNTMLASSGTPWGYRYSPEAVAYARAKLANSPAPMPQSVSGIQSAVNQATSAIQTQIAQGTISSEDAQAIANAAGRVQAAAQVGGITGAIRQATGVSPVLLVGGAALAYLLLRRK